MTIYLIDDCFFKATNECLKRELFCPPALKCIRKGHSYVCGCDPGFKVVGGGNARKCEGIYKYYVKNLVN